MYYRLTMGEENYKKSLSSAVLLNTNLKQSSKGSLEHFYDTDGNQIRGWHHKSISFKREQHPLIQKYRSSDGTGISGVRLRIHKPG